MKHAELNPREYDLQARRRLVYSSRRATIFKILGMLFAIGAAGIVISMNDISPWEMTGKIGTSILGTPYGREQLLILTTPILLFGTSLLISMSVGLYNFGMMGQFYLGAWAGASIGLFVDGPPAVMLALMFLAGAIAGALFALVPAILRIKYGINELLTTIMFNSIAVFFVLIFVMGDWRTQTSVQLNVTANMKYALPKIIGDLHIGIIIAVLIVVIVYLLLKKTVWGYEITSVGENPKTARYAGMDVNRKMYTAFLASGAVAGIAGVIELAGTAHHLSTSLSIGYSWIGVNAAFLAGSSPLALIPYGILMALITYSGVIFQTRGLSVDMILAITGLILLATAIGEFVSNYDFTFNKKAATANETDVKREEKWSS